jgi:hypothetical protein
MAISTYSELQTALRRWPGRENQAGWSDRVIEFISLAEGHLNAVLPLRINITESTLTTSTTETVALPSDFVEAHALWHTSSPYEMLVPRAAGDLPYNPTAGRPAMWALDGANIDFERACDQAYTLRFVYRAKFALSDSTPTNWLLTNHPGAYLYAALYEAGAFMDDSEYESKMGARRDEAVAEARKIAARGGAIVPARSDPALMAIGSRGYMSRWPSAIPV